MNRIFDEYSLLNDQESQNQLAIIQQQDDISGDILALQNSGLLISGDIIGGGASLTINEDNNKSREGFMTRSVPQERNKINVLDYEINDDEGQLSQREAKILAQASQSMQQAQANGSNSNHHNAQNSRSMLKNIKSRSRVVQSKQFLSPINEQQIQEDMIINNEGGFQKNNEDNTAYNSQ